MSYRVFTVPGTGLEPARLAALAPETSASTIPPPGHCECKDKLIFRIFKTYLCSFRNFMKNILENILVIWLRCQSSI